MGFAAWRAPPRGAVNDRLPRVRCDRTTGAAEKPYAKCADRAIRARQERILETNKGMGVASSEKVATSRHPRGNLDGSRFVVEKSQLLPRERYARQKWRFVLGNNQGTYKFTGIIIQGRDFTQIYERFLTQSKMLPQIAEGGNNALAPWPSLTLAPQSRTTHCTSVIETNTNHI